MKFLVAGDFIPQKRIAEKISIRDFSFLDSIRSVLDRIDYAIVNLETPVSDGRKTGPNLISTEDALDALQYAGFRCVTLANNHFRDYGQFGVDSTIELCRRKGIDYVGGGETIDEARRFLIIEDKDTTKRIAIINVCETEWSIANEHRGGSNPLDLIDLHRDIMDAKSQCEHVIVIIHGGVEGYSLPTPRMQKVYRFLIDIGVDIVIGHHQHCLSGIEVYNGKPILYGLGNFCYDNGKKERSFWNEGIMVEFEIGPQIEFSIIPIIQCAEDAMIKVHIEDQTINSRIEKMSSIVADPVTVAQHFCQFCEMAGKSRLSMLQPWQGAFWGRLYGHGLLPGLLSQNWIKIALGLFRCESHRDVLLNYFENQVPSNEDSHS